MTLSPGTRIGSFEVLAPIGAGGMGEVYRARDSKLKREVAVKVLTEDFATDSFRMARFQREAELLAALNHPNIATIYGVENRALVMELVEGESPKGPLPFDEAWRIASQIAAALEYAHDKGIVHRDLKPANIKVTPEGTVKLLDFGLAKAFNEPASTTAPDPSNSPTLTMGGATQAGVVLGTAAYMSPEQARGRPADKRADIWAFGVVLYELLTGRKLFDGEDASEIMAAVIRDEPRLDDIPAAARPLLRACLEKDPRKRLRDIGDCARLLGAASEPVVPAARTTGRWLLLLVATAVVAAAVGVLLRMPMKTEKPPAQPLMRLDVDLGVPISPGLGAGPTLAISSDGKRLAFISRGQDGKDHLHLRRMDNSQATILAGTEDAESPFFSPDGGSVGFFADGKLKKVSVEGGAPVILANARNPRGAFWGVDGTILFAAENRVGLSRIPESGGTVQQATELDATENEISNRYPQLLPDGDTIMFTARTDKEGWDDASIKVQSVKTRKRKTIIKGGYYGRYLPSGHFVYVHAGTLFAAPMNLQRLELTGPSTPVLQDLGREAGNGYSKFDFTSSGTFVYVTGPSEAAIQSFFFLDASGKKQPLGLPPIPPSDASLSPDGTSLAFVIVDDSGAHLSIFDLTRNRISRLADMKGGMRSLVWSPDSKRLVFYGDGRSPNTAGIYWIRGDGAGEPMLLVEGGLWMPSSFTPDGKRLVYWHAQRPWGVWTISLDFADPQHPTTGKPETLLMTERETRNPTISSDGHWMGYSSYDSGRLEAYVRPFPGPGRERQVSTEGAGAILWSPNGRELFYALPFSGQLRAVDYTSSGDSFTMSQPRSWSDKLSVSGRIAGLMPDGKRFVISQPMESDNQKPEHLVFLLNFFEELQRRIPTGK